MTLVDQTFVRVVKGILVSVSVSQRDTVNGNGHGEERGVARATPGWMNQARNSHNGSRQVDTVAPQISHIECRSWR